MLNRRQRHVLLKPACVGAVLGLLACHMPGESYADAGAVDNWPDLSGNGNDATQGTVANQPTFQTNELNGQPVVRFDISNDGMLTALNLVRPNSMVVVAMQPTPIVPTRVVNSGTANRLISIRRASNTVYAAGDIRSSPFGADGVFSVVSLVMPSAADPVLWSDGVDITDPSPSSDDWGTVGLGYNAMNPEAADAFIASTYAFTSALTAPLRRRIEHALARLFKLPCA